MQDIHHTSFTVEEVKLLYMLIKEEKSKTQYMLEQTELTDDDRDLVLTHRDIVNSCYRKLKESVSKIPPD